MTKDGLRYVNKAPFLVFVIGTNLLAKILFLAITVEQFTLVVIHMARTFDLLVSIVTKYFVINKN